MDEDACQSAQSESQEGSVGNRGIGLDDREVECGGRGYRTKYTYDWLGNRLSSGYNGVGTNFFYGVKTNRLERIHGSFVPSISFTWDVAGRLESSSDGSTYAYSAGERRVRKDTPTEAVLYHYDAGGRIIAETRPDGTRLRDYVYLGNKLLLVDGCVSVSSNCSEREWYHTDALGSVLARTDSAGAVTAQLEYSPWGEQYGAGFNGTPGVRQYNGRVYDQGTGLHDYGARMYWPELGRFISADSYGGDPGNPASLNRYSYVHNNPYKYVDPSGHYVESPIDVAFILFDLGSAAYHTATGNTEAFNVDMAALGVDLLCLVTPGVAGGGAAVRAGNEGVHLLYGGTKEATQAVVKAEQIEARASAKTLRREWEAAHGEAWQKDAATGRNQDAAHRKALADGGTNHVSNIEPKPHGEHVKEHSEAGDFKRWGERAKQGGGR